MNLYLTRCNQLSAEEIAMCLAADPDWQLPAWSYQREPRMRAAWAVLRVYEGVNDGRPVERRYPRREERVA